VNGRLDPAVPNEGPDILDPAPIAGDLALLEHDDPGVLADPVPAPRTEVPRNDLASQNVDQYPAAGLRDVQQFSATSRSSAGSSK
jgi:hypothetical protein